MREEFRLEDINLLDIDDEDGLIQQLTMLNYDVHSNGQIQVEPKKQAKKRTKMGSPDRGDCLAMAFAPDSMVCVL